MVEKNLIENFFIKVRFSSLNFQKFFFISLYFVRELTIVKLNNYIVVFQK